MIYDSVKCVVDSQRGAEVLLWNRYQFRVTRWAVTPTGWRAVINDIHTVTLNRRGDGQFDLCFNPWRLA